MRNDITGIILCGGKSSRMQTNKALLKLGDKTIIEIILEEMKKVFSDIILSANECDDFSFLNIPIVKDSQVNRGPLAGIYSSLKYSTTQKNFITTCDLPLINHKIIEFLLQHNSDAQVIVPTFNDETERLFGLFDKSLLIKIENIFNLSENDKSVKGSVYDLHQAADVRQINITGVESFNEEMFLNMNTPDDYARIKKYFNN